MVLLRRMTFENSKKTFLAKLDKSKKGGIDTKAVMLIDTINELENYFTTSSCSGRVYYWQGSGKKNETQWLKISHDLVDEEWFSVGYSGDVWLRYEPFIIHIACRDMDCANRLLNVVRGLYKKSSILSASRKIVVEIRGSAFVEMPYFVDGKRVFNGSNGWLMELINGKLRENWKRMEKLCGVLSELED